MCERYTQETVGDHTTFRKPDLLAYKYILAVV